jgi:hypothetical protein
MNTITKQPIKPVGNKATRVIRVASRSDAAKAGKWTVKKYRAVFKKLAE